MFSILLLDLQKLKFTNQPLKVCQLPRLSWVPNFPEN